ATSSSMTVSPAFRLRSATATLSAEESRITARSERSARFPSSELAILVVSGDGIHAVDQRATHVALGRDDLFGLRDHFFVNRVRTDDHAVAIPEQVVAAGDRDGADRHRLAVAVRDPALDDVRGRQERAENGEALREYEIGVARAAVDDVAEHAARMERL